METMKAAVLHGKKDIRIEDVPMPNVGKNDALIQIKAVGICGSDVHYYEHFGMGDSYKLTEPQILGHEASGEIVAIGEDVVDFKIGDRVTIEPGETCFQCPQCKSGHYNLCKNVHFLSTPFEKGAFAQYLVMPTYLLFKIPNELSYEIACMAEPLSVGIHACRLAQVMVGKSVLILGAGPIGLLSLIAARAYGATNIIVADIQDYKLELAKKYGAKHIINSSKNNIMEEINKLTDNIGVDCCIETAGSSITHKQTVQVTRAGGIISLVGITKEMEVPISTFDIIDKEITIKGVFRYTNTYKTAIEILNSGIIDFNQMITAKYPLDMVKDALECSLNNKETMVKTIVVNA